MKNQAKSFGCQIKTNVKIVASLIFITISLTWAASRDRILTLAEACSEAWDTEFMLLLISSVV